MPTSGWMPKGFLTENGPCPELAVLYGLMEMESAAYPPRTKRNAGETDGTVWIEGPGDVADDRGYRTTSNAASAHGKPFLRIPVNLDPEIGAERLRAWITEHGIRRLNVAGPRASRWPEGRERTREIIKLLISPTPAP